MWVLKLGLEAQVEDENSPQAFCGGLGRRVSSFLGESFRSGSR